MAAPRRFLSVLAIGVLVTFVAITVSTSEPKPLPPGNQMVLLELFTSQGCSSCPPADRILSKLAKDPELRDRIVPLAFHVDYWNYIGWTDPFSDSEYSQRQRDYGRRFRLQSVYTPQIVIQGRRQMVGSRELQIRNSIRELLAEPEQVELEATANRHGNVVEINLNWVSGKPLGGPAKLFVALFENDLVTEVPRGENRGRSLHNDHVVRVIHLVDTIDSGERSGRRRITLEIEPGWNLNEIGVAAFVQDAKDGTVHAATATKL